MKDEIVAIAIEILKMSKEDVIKNSKSIPEIDGFYFWNPTRGGLSIIINSNCEKLGATSSVSFEKHLKAFIEGKRN